MKQAWLELTLVFLTGVCHLVFDGLLHFKGPFIIAAAFAWTVYIVWRLRTPSQAREWGLRCDTLLPSLAANMVFLVIGSLAIVGYGLAQGRGVPSAGFFYLIALYPVWGLIQQLLLCPIIYSNLHKLSRSRITALGISAFVFGLVHAPDWGLCALTTGAAVIWILLFLRWPNIWAQGLSHGWLAALTYYYVLARDPWIEVMNSLGY